MNPYILYINMPLMFKTRSYAQCIHNVSKQDQINKVKNTPRAPEYQEASTHQCLYTVTNVNE